MDLRKLKTLVDLVSDSNITELEITEAEGKVRIVKAAPIHTTMMAGALAPMLVAAPVAVPVAAAAPPPEPEPIGQVVKSPMVGTFYRASGPGAKPLADIGQTIKAGEAICIIEAMKIMNEVESDATGTVTQVLVEDGQAVEFGQPLFVVE